MAFAAAPGKAHGAKGRQAALVVGSPLFASKLRNIVARSHWELEWPANSDAAIELLNKQAFRVVICEGDCEKTLDRINQLVDPPAVIAVVDQADARTCDRAIRSAVLYMDSRELLSGGLFPLLNLAWRMKNQD